jgi:hypothetical protein
VIKRQIWHAQRHNFMEVANLAYRELDAASRPRFSGGHRPLHGTPRAALHRTMSGSSVIQKSKRQEYVMATKASEKSGENQYGSLPTPESSACGNASGSSTTSPRRRTITEVTWDNTAALPMATATTIRCGRTANWQVDPLGRPDRAANMLYTMGKSDRRRFTGGQGQAQG